MIENVLNFEFRNIRTMEISFHFQKIITLKNRNRLRQAIARVFEKSRVQAESVSIIFCSDQYLLEINQSFLQHDFFTDIITFNLAENADLPVIGELYISVDTVRSNAGVFAVNVNHELHRVIFHGILHLCGFKDKSRKDIQAMRNAEARCLENYFS